MPLRIANGSCLGTFSIGLLPSSKRSPSLSVPRIANASSQAQQRRYRDPYAIAQAKQRKLANIQRQETLAAQRKEALGDPIRGVATPFVQSFDDAGISSASTPNVEADNSEASRLPLNHFLTPSELERSLQHSFILSQPVLSRNRDLQDPAREAEQIRTHASDHDRATAAIARIVSLNNGNQKDRTRVNIQRCIETFGRHETDTTLRPRAQSNQFRDPAKTPQAEKTPRAGPDTGSSEVQIAILTAKIRVLANHLEQKGGNNDKINKRNLRILVHKRQKLLAYLRNKERGGDRWSNLVEKLGLTEGTWRGEISL